MTADPWSTFLTTPAQRCLRFLALSKRHCSTPATHKAFVGCVHEHVFETFVCDEHLSGFTDGTVNCAACFRMPGRDSHICVLFGSTEPLTNLES